MGVILHLIPVLAILLYAVSSVFYVRGLSQSETSRSKLATGLLFGGFVFHVLFIALRYAGVSFTTEPLPVLSLPDSLSKVGVLLIGIFLLLERPFRVQSLGAFIAPLGVLVMLFSGVLFHVNRDVRPMIEVGPALLVHIALVLVAIAIFVLGFGVSAAVILQETLIKKKRFSRLQQKLPSLNVLDKLNAKLVGWGVFLMSCGIALGAFFAITSDVPSFWLDARFVWSILTLAVYAVLFVARVSYGWRGRRAAWLSIAGFFTLVASFVGVHVVSRCFHIY